MTRNPGFAMRFDYTTFGVPGEARLVVVLREGAAAVSDTDREVTEAHSVRILAIRLRRTERGRGDVTDSGAYGGETPASATVVALADLVAEQVQPGATLGLAGVAGAGPEAVLLASRLGDLVDRLALVGVAVAQSPLERHLAEEVLCDIAARTLLLGREGDAEAGIAAARWHLDHLPEASIELVPPAPPGVDPRLSLSEVWERVLEHTAPGTGRIV